MSTKKVNGVHTVDFTTQSSIMETRGSVISGHNVVYSVDVRKGPCCCGQVTQKQILKGVDCIFKPGMNAILGPTGSGKSSLLDVLAGRKDPSGLQGEILFDGVPPPENFKCMVGYVVQDDVVMGTLTVRENFQFSAALRLPSNLTKADRDERVNTVIQELGLSHCADTKVGNEFIRGVSGGERKRTNIGMELIISPPVLFLDEPTTGLDANTANSVMLLLRRLALKGRTIIFSIHQPRYSIYRLFDTLMMLSLGEVVYHGPTKDSLDYFHSIGYTIQEHNNPPDFFLDVISGDFNVDVDTLDPEKTSTDEEDVHGALVQKFRQSNVNAKVQSEVKAIFDEYQSKLTKKELVSLPPVEYNTSFFTQLLICSGRTVKNIARNPQTSIMQLFVILIFAAIVGGIYWQIENDCKAGIQNRVGAFFFIVMNQVFGNLSAVELFIKERAIFMHENVSGFYRVSAYFFSKIFCDVIPMRLFPVVIFSAVTYFMIGFTAEVDKFFIYTLSLFAVAMAASGLAFFFSALVKIFAIANLCIALCYVFMMVFSGLLINISSIAEWLRWIKWLSIFRYGLNALNINELKDKHFDNSTVCGNEYLSEQGIEYETDFDLWQNIMAMLVFSAFFLILTYVRLATMNKLK
ncbi:broad substrate specificity ATP-binding cassette transporter ABCG2-like isoform X2 [Saccostrea cucullata]|uniref:broad substrate specificity ATP-binding cassette transporter ABCG2-like isoform X1 n=1 Tax=Saccostrea cuccullata TaxID=36930 RepID=UPI002ED226ED